MKVKRPGRCHYSARVRHRRQRSARRSSYRKQRQLADSFTRGAKLAIPAWANARRICRTKPTTAVGSASTVITARTHL